MAYTVTANALENINLAPETVVEEVLQNVAMIISTPQFSVPIDRGFGLPQRFIDKPLPVAEAIVIAEVLDAIEAYEPRAEVEKVSFEQNHTAGKLVPRVEVNIIGG